MPEETLLPPPPSPEDFAVPSTGPAPAPIGPPEPEPAQPVIDFPPSSLAPLTERAAAAQFTSTRNVMKATSFESRNVAPGIPLDTQEGISTWDRLVLSERKAKSDQLRYLRGKYGADKVRESDTGDWIVRVTDPETGKPKDILADPRRLDMGDFVSLMGDAPEIAGYVMGEKLGTKLPIVGRLKGLLGVGRDVVAGAAGAGVAGAAQDIAVRAGEAPIDLPEITRRRMAGFAGNVVLGGVTVPAQRFVQWTKAPFQGSRGETQFDAIAAQKFFRENYGEDVPLSVGQLTGSPDIIRREKFTGKVLGGSRTYQDFERQQTRAMQKLQAILMGSEPADDAVLGQQITQALQRKVAPAVEGVETAGKALAGEAQANIQQLVEGQTLAGASLTKTYVGDAIRDKLVALRDAAKAEADRLFGEFRAISGDQPNISGAPLAAAAAAIKKDAASVFKQKPTGLVGPTGQPLTRTAQEASAAFVPEASVMKRLDELISNRSGKYRFSDLQKMRTEVYDDLAKSEAVPGMGAHYLSRIGKALTEAMEQGVAAMPDPAAKGALEAANKWYREKVVPFEEVDKLFRQPGEAGFVGPAQLASQLMSGPVATDRFNTLKKFLGSASPEFLALKRSIADDILLDATEPGATTLNARKFLKGFSDFSRANPEIAAEVFGPTAPKVMEQARFMIRAQEGMKFPADETADLLRSGSPTVAKLQGLMRAEATKDKVFQSQMLKAIAEHDTSSLKLTPEDVVNRFLTKPENNIEEVTEVMALLSDRPDLVQDIRARYLENVLTKADESGISVAKAIQQAGTDRRAKVVLGNKLFEDLGKYGALKAGIDFPKGVAEQAGAITAGGLLDRVFVQPLKSLKHGLREWVTAQVLTNPKTREWVTKVGPSDPSTLQLVLTSAPFVQSIARNFGPGREGQNAAQSIKHGLDEWLAGQGGANAPAAQSPSTLTPPSPDMFKPKPKE